MTTRVKITLGDLEFVARLESAEAPETCALFQSMLPYQATMVHACWSGEAGVILLADVERAPQIENATSHPSVGDILFYAGGRSEPKILFPYGSAEFTSKVGLLAGNHFLTIEENREQLGQVDRLLLWQGAQNVMFEIAD
jgi:hypothetical protein